METARARDPHAGRSAPAAAHDEPTLRERVEAAFADEGPIASRLAGYEPREGQRRMAAAVADVLEGGGTLLAEAGTGTGKTLAYLVPALLSGHRLLVSTGTKNLQEQIFNKDLPALRQALGIPFTAALMKGRGNYLCLHRWEIYRDGVESEVSAQGRLVETGDRMLVPIVDDWLRRTKTGDRAELADLPEDVAIWKDIAADASTCLGQECPRHGDCFVTLMRQRAAEADVVIVNHHLLCADAAVRQSAYGEVIPACNALVVDEAHGLEDVATQHFGLAVSTFRIDDLLRDVSRVLPPGEEWTPRALNALERVRNAADVFFGGLLQPASGALDSSGAPAAAESRVRYTSETIAPHADSGFDLAGALAALAMGLASRRMAGGPEGRPLQELAGPMAPGEDGLTWSDSDDASDESTAQDDGLNEALNALERRAGELRQELEFLLRADESGFVYFLERRARVVALRAAPVDVARIVSEQILEPFRSVVLTSATLTVDRSFSYIRGRLGIAEADELRVPSEYDFATQALLYLPLRMPSPKSADFAEAVGREAARILQRTEGRAFVLFTSYSVLRRAQQLLEMTLPYPILVQGTAPRGLLIERFRNTPHAVLLGTASFWQGVDVAGEALSCVIIDRLPFASPADPITAARIDAIREAGGDPFGEYQVPLAILMLQQGLGRLIRQRADRGVLAVLDPRLRTMGYGRRFLASLPPAPVTHDLDAVARFFK